MFFICTYVPVFTCDYIYIVYMLDRFCKRVDSADSALILQNSSAKTASTDLYSCVCRLGMCVCRNELGKRFVQTQPRFLQTRTQGLQTSPNPLQLQPTQSANERFLQTWTLYSADSSYCRFVRLQTSCVCRLRLYVCRRCQLCNR